MYTECPSCHTYFKITPEQLKIAEGKVRCGSCDHVFNALSSLAEKVPPTKTSEKEVSEPIAASEFENTQSIAAFQVDDPESEAALADISLPLGADAESTVESKGEESGLESVTGLSALMEQADEVSSIPEANSKLENATSEKAEPMVSELMTQFEEPVTANINGDDKESVSGFSGLVSNAETSEPVSEKRELESHLSQLEMAEEPVSFADVEVPGLSEESVSQVSASVAPESTPDELDEINKDIDNALNNLFDDESQIENPDSLKLEDPLSKETPLSEMENIPGLEDSPQKSDFLQQGNPVENISEVDLSDQFGDTKPSREKPSKEHPPTEVTEIDLSDSFLSSEPIAMDGDEWEPLSKSRIETETETENTGTDNFKLEEIRDDKEESSGAGSRAVWVVLIVILLFVLVGQFTYLKREELAKYAAVRPVLDQVCAIINTFSTCEVPDPREVESIVIIERNVVSHPNAKNALLITSKINNEAGFVQQYPQLVLTFSDINQSVLARRSFSPEEYLAKGVDIEAGMEPHKPIKIMLEIVDPGEAAVNFEFEFR